MASIFICAARWSANVTGSAQFHLNASAFAVDIAVTGTRHVSIDSTIETAIADLYRVGESHASISRATGLSQRVIRQTLLRLGVPSRPRCAVSGTYQHDILALHAGGKSIKEISKELGLNFATVYGVLRRTGRIQKKRGRSPPIR